MLYCLIPPDCNIPAKFWTRGYSHEKNRLRARPTGAYSLGGGKGEGTKMTGMGGGTCQGGDRKCSKKAEKDEETGRSNQVVRAGLTEEVT